MSPISSRNRVPPSAISTRPSRALSAPVNAPFSCPKSSDSSSSAGIAAQLTETRRPFRPDAAWIARATSSLPVPVSPRTRTLVGASATTVISFFSSFMGADCPIMMSSTESRIAWNHPIHTQINTTGVNIPARVTTFTGRCQNFGAGSERYASCDSFLTIFGRNPRSLRVSGWVAKIKLIEN